MKEKIDPTEWSEDFKFFLEVLPLAPPRDIKQELFSLVHADLNPTFAVVLAKLGGLHLLGGSLSLLLCSQFGVGPGYNLMHLFMSQGIFICMAVCGALFLGLTVMLAGIVLSNAELKKIRATGYAPIVLLGSLSLVFFFIFGAQFAINLALFWLLGAVVTGAIFTEASLRLKELARVLLAPGIH